MSSLDDQSQQSEVLGSSLGRYVTGSESVFLWQVAMGLPLEPASAVAAAMHRSAVHSG